MKNRLNITVDPVLVDQAKRYAEKHQTSLSQMVEEYFKTLLRPANRKNILDVLDELPKPEGKREDFDVNQQYYESRKKKYGF